MSPYEINYNISASDPWAPFNEAIKRRQENPESFNDQEQTPWPWTFEAEDENDQGSLIDENKDKQTIVGESCNQENAPESESESEDHQNGECEAETSSRYDDSESEESEYEPYDGPDDYILDLFDIKNVNPAVEDALVHVKKMDAKRRALEYKIELAAILKEQKEQYYNPTPVDEESDESSEKLPEVPLPPYNPLYDEIREKRSERRLQFGNTRVIRFKRSDIVARDGSKVPKDKQPGKSILKNDKDHQLFVTPNYDYDLVGEDKLFTAIARLYNLCDMPLEVLDRKSAFYSIENLASGFASAVKTKELCWKHESDEAVRVREEQLEEYEEELEALEDENDSLNAVVAELKEKLREKEIKLEDEVRESRINLSLLEEAKQGMKQAVAEAETLKLDLLQARSMADGLLVENDGLRKELQDCQNNLCEQKKASKPLLKQIKELEARMVREQKCALDSQQKLTFLERYRSESFVLQNKIEELEASNRKYISESGRLKEENEDLLRKSSLLENSLALTDDALITSRKRAIELAMANIDLAKQLDESNANVKRLVDTKNAYKKKLHLTYQEFEKKYAQVSNQCINRRDEIEKTKLEMEEMGESLKETRKQMTRKRGKNTVNICRENMVVDEPPLAVSTAQSSHVKGRHRIFQSLTNGFYSSPVVNIGDV
ncbi:hypothetical protein HG537_0F03570 [Torulaspora globosa]|uniref:Uncharacterized protein n=1 Tax=Torulaspora globosa TaxID=48254 RepID=A0A7H9HYE6_9SACH|nr:hypothetical protein HG537_0F03570 [Torulaspora sp. CBS 2947]